MKPTILTILLVFMGCFVMAQSTAEKAIEAQLNKAMKATAGKDFTAFRSVFTDDVKIYGTDPGEAPFETDAAMKSMEDLFAMEEMKVSFDLQHRDIIMSPDATSAIAVEQGFHSILSKNMQARAVYQFHKINDEWLCSFYSVAMIPLNENLPKVDKAVEKN